ncbi:MAG: AAA family ATPase [Chloroflexota bacterium]|nr:AAA family ATPase [Chloroflexota bacterium]
MTRTDWSEVPEPWWVCFEEAWSAYCAGSLPIGAAIVDGDGRVVARGRNRIFEDGTTASGLDLVGHRLAHAEMNALLRLDHPHVDVRTCVLYTTLEPCALCVGAIRMLAVSEVRYIARDPTAGSIALLHASTFMRSSPIRVVAPHDASLEALSIALNVEAHLRLVQRLGVRSIVGQWDAAGLPGVALGHELFDTSELRQLAADATSIAAVVERLAPRLEHAVAAVRTGPQTHTGPCVLLVTGAPASGKSTLGRRLARDLGLPFISKDLFKETLFDTLGWDDRAWSRRAGLASIKLMYRTAAALLEAGQSVAMESTFSPQWDTPALLELAQTSGCQFVQVVCKTDGSILYERFEQRARSGERHPGHADDKNLDEWRGRLLTEQWPALPLAGPVLEVDTTTKLDSLGYRDVLARVGATLHIPMS